MTNFLTSWHQKYAMTSKIRHDVEDTPWRNFWHHDVFLTQWRTFWCHDALHDERFDVMTYFWKVWHNVKKSIIMLTFLSWRQEMRHDVKHFLTSCRIYDVMTMFESWRTSWRHDELFDIMTYFGGKDALFDVMTNLLMSWGTLWRHDVFLTSWRTLLTSWCVLTSCILYYCDVNFDVMT